MLHRFFRHRLFAIAIVALLGFIFSGCAGQGTRFEKALPLIEEDMEAKALTPRPEKSLVYFYYGRYPAPKGTEISLDGAAANVKKDTYLVWETSPGRHEMGVTFYKMMSQDHSESHIKTEAGQTHFYYLYMEQDSTSTERIKAHNARFVEVDEKTGRQQIAKYSLMGWFRDGDVVFLRESDASPEGAQESAEASIPVADSTPSMPVEQADELPAVPEAPAEVAEKTLEMAPVPELDDAADIPEPAAPIQGRYYALVIGISAYEQLETLPSAVNDAQAVADALRGYGFKVNTLLNDKATRERILDSLDVFQRLLEPEDKLLVYYAGHGRLEADGQRAYWMPVNAAPDSVSQWIAAETITAGVKRIPAKQVLIVADSVYSGTLERALQSDLQSEPARSRYLEKISGKSARLVLKSGTEQPLAGESESSLFADAFVTGLKEMDSSMFTAEELFLDSIREVVAGQSAQLPEYLIIRNSGHQGGDFMFVRP